eukprot:g14638.t1
MKIVRCRALRSAGLLAILAAREAVAATTSGFVVLEEDVQLSQIDSTSGAQAWAQRVLDQHSGQRKLRVLTVIDPPFIWQKSQADAATGRPLFRGFLVDLLDEMTDRLGLEYEFVNELNETYTYTNVLEKVGNGDADLMWAAHWLVPARLGAGPANVTLGKAPRGRYGVRFLTPYMMGGVGLAARSLLLPKTTTMERVMELVDPFSGEVWTTFGAILFVTSILLMLLDHTGVTTVLKKSLEHTDGRVSPTNVLPTVLETTEDSGKRAPPDSPRSPTLSVIADRMVETLAYEKHRRKPVTFASFFDGIFLAFTALTQSNWFEKPRTPAAKLLLLGFSFVSLIFVAAYTAHLTANLTYHPQVSTDIDSYEALVALGYRVCIRDGTYMRDLLGKVHSDLHQVPYGLPSENHAWLVNPGGRCDATAGDAPIMEYFAATTCGIEYLPRTEMVRMPYVTAFSRRSVTFPTSHLLEPAMSYIMLHLRDSERLDELREKYFNPPSTRTGKQCGVENTSTSDGKLSMKMEQIYGLVALYTVFIALSVTLHCSNRIYTTNNANLTARLTRTLRPRVHDHEELEPVANSRTKEALCGVDV